MTRTILAENKAKQKSLSRILRKKEMMNMGSQRKAARKMLKKTLNRTKRSNMGAMSQIRNRRLKQLKKHRPMDRLPNAVLREGNLKRLIMTP